MDSGVARRLIAFAHEVSHDIRVLLIDQNSNGLRPILDAHRQYSKVMARFFCFLIAFENNAYFNRMLSYEKNSAILLMKSAYCPLENFNSHIRPIWLICVSQPVSSIRLDIARTIPCLTRNPSNDGSDQMASFQLHEKI